LIILIRFLDMQTPIDQQEKRFNELLAVAETQPEVLSEAMAYYLLLGADNLNQSFTYFSRFSDLCRKWSNGSNLAEGIFQAMTGLKLFQETKFLESMSHSKRAIDIFSVMGHTDLLGVSEMGYGACLRSLGEIDHAVDHFLKAGELINPESNFSIYLGYTNYQLGEVYLFIRDFELAEKYFSASAKLAEEKGYRTPLFRNWNGLGNLFLARNDFESAHHYINKSLEIADSDSQKSRALCDLGVLYLAQRYPDKALAVLKESYEIRNRASLPDAATTSQIHLAETFLELNDPQKALEIILLALETATKFNAKGKIVACYKILREVHSQLENWKTAVDFYSKYDLLQDELNSVKLQNIYKLKNHKIEQQKELIEMIHSEFQDSVRYACRIQKAILPPDNFLANYFEDSFVLHKPKDIVAGDFYWFEKRNSLLFFAVADCTGHGVPGAMVSLICSGAMNRAVKEFGLIDPGQVLDKVRELVLETFERSGEEVRDGMDIALCVLDGHKLSFAGAHNSVWILRGEGASQEFIDLRGDKQPVGRFEFSRPFQTVEYTVKTGDVLYLFSDGYADQFGGEKEKKLKEKRLKEILKRIAKLPLSNQLGELTSHFEKWRGKLDQVDDVCGVGIRI